MRIKYLILSFIFLIFTRVGLIQAQNYDYATYSAFMNNKLLYNPAAAGTSETQFNASIISRFQWSNVSGAPFSALFWADYRFRPQNMAIGATVYQDRLGANVTTDYLANYAYKIYLTKQIKLSMGLSAGASNISFDPSKVQKWDDGDQVFDGAIINILVPKFGLGFYLYGDKFYISLSSPDLVMVGGAQYDLTNPGNIFQKRRNYMAMGGYHFKLTDKYALNTNVFLRYNSFSGFKADFNAQVELTDYFWLGGTYSTSNNHSFMVGTHLSSRMKFGYAYGFRLGDSISPLLYSHELNLILMLDQIFARKQN